METQQLLNLELDTSLEEKLDRIRLPRLQNQRETAVVLSAVEDTLKDQQYGPTPTAYFAALLALLGQSVQLSTGAIKKDLALSVVYLLDLVMPFVPPLLLRQKFSQILTNVMPVLTNPDFEAALIKSSIGCIESLLIAQHSAAWALPNTENTPRRALSGLLLLTFDRRPKVRKRAQDAITRVIKSPPGPLLDHPAVDMCAEVAMRNLCDITGANANNDNSDKGRSHNEQLHFDLIHAIRAVKTIAAASGSWPSKKIEPLCRVLLLISKSTNEYLIRAAFEIFELIFAGMADDFASTKATRLLEAILELRPPQNDSQLLPPWIAVISRAYDVSAQIFPEATFCRLPEIFEIIANFLASSSQNIRLSASECLISFLINCIPNRIILEPSIDDEKIFDHLARLGTSLLSSRYNAGWIEVFKIISTIFQTLKWRSSLRMNEVISIVGELRKADSFQGKKEADSILGNAVEAIGPGAVLDILPLNLAKPRLGEPGRAWLLPILRDHVENTNLAHFRVEFVPLSEALFQKVIENESYEKSMEIKIFETLIQQIWALLPGYCNLPLDLTTAFDKGFAELLANMLYKHVELRPNICKALQMLVISNQEILTAEAPDQDLRFQGRVTKEVAQQNLAHLSKFAENLLAILFNVYSETLPQFRGYILQSIDAYLSLIPEQELLHTFSRVASLLRNAFDETKPQTRTDKQIKAESTSDKMPHVTHTLMDLIITISIYLPRSAFADLFSLAALLLPRAADPQIQKKVYKMLPRLASCSTGALALQDRSSELQDLLINSASTAGAPCRRDRLDAIGVVIQHLPMSCLHFIPSTLSEVVISTREVNEKARAAAFNVLITMARKMNQGGIICQSKIIHMPPDSPNAQASLEEFITMISAGLVGSSAQVVSASISALARILYEFHIQLSLNVVEDLVETMDLFLTSPNREIVRSVLGFAKVAVVVLPQGILVPRLKTLVPSLMSWSREHKTQFRSKIKHLIERMIRRLGFELVYKHCPEDDRKFINNIRKAKERRKRKKDAAADADHENGTTTEKRRLNFESEYDQAIYQSEESDNVNGDSETDASDNCIGRRRMRATKAYILEGSEEPLDLLDKKAIAHISSQKPVRVNNSLKPRNQINANSDIDGKLNISVERRSSDYKATDAIAIDARDQGVDEDGIGAYTDTISGRDAVQRGRGGRLKFSNKRKKDGERDIEVVVGKINVKEKKGVVKRRSVENSVRPKHSTANLQMRRPRYVSVCDDKSQQAQRRGLGVVRKVRSGRIGKRR